MENEIAIRCGKSEYKARTWRAIFRTHFDDEEIEELFNKYKTELKSGIEKIHNGLQSMECLSDDWSFDAIKIKYLPELQDYGYEDEKIFYLFPCGAVEDKEYTPMEYCSKIKRTTSARFSSITSFLSCFL